MKRVLAILTLSVCLMFVAAKAADTEKFIGDVAGKTRNSVALLSYTLYGEDGKSQTVPGQAICIDPSGIFITTAFDPMMDPKMLKDKDGKTNINLTFPGADGKTVKAAFMGVDLVSGIGFVKADAADAAAQKATFVPVEFTDAPLKIGQQVVSVGIVAGDGNRSPYYGTAYVAGILRVPGPLVMVTGGDLTNPGSPVFGADGKAVGFVGRQIPLMSKMETNQGAIPAPIRGEDKTTFFVPVEDFIQALKKENMPQEGKTRRAMWIGIYKFTAVNEDNAKTLHVDPSAVMIENVIKDEPAEQAGLKDGEIIVSINGQKLEKMANPAYSVQSFMRQLMKLQDKQQVTLGIMDDKGKLREVSVKFKEMPKTFEEAARLVDQVQGMQLRERVLPLDLYLNSGAIAKYDGLVVEGVGQNSPAAKLGIGGGDLITEVDGKAVKTVADYKVAIEAKKGQSARLKIYKNGSLLATFITLDIPTQR